MKASPSPSEVDASKRRRLGKDMEPSAIVKASPLITLTLREMHEIVRLFTSSPPGCVDWAMISQTATGGRIPPSDVEYLANEFLPHVHFRPSVGLVVMERSSRGPSEYQKHRQTLKRMRQGLVPMLTRLRQELAPSDQQIVPATEKLDVHESEELNVMEDLQMQEIKEEPVITPIGSPADSVADVPTPAVPISTGKRTIESFLSGLSRPVLEDLQARADKAMARLQRGEVPLLAMRASAATENETATGRVKRRYETKAMRLAKEAATAMIDPPVVQPPLVKAEAPPFFLAAARQFA